jgi:hypothetical protein
MQRSVSSRLDAFHDFTQQTIFVRITLCLMTAAVKIVHFRPRHRSQEAAVFIGHNFTAFAAQNPVVPANFLQQFFHCAWFAGFCRSADSLFSFWVESNFHSFACGECAPEIWQRQSPVWA